VKLEDREQAPKKEHRQAKAGHRQFIGQIHWEEISVLSRWLASFKMRGTGKTLTVDPASGANKTKHQASSRGLVLEVWMLEFGGFNNPARPGHAGIR
jgi:hypothetical protein